MQWKLLGQLTGCDSSRKHSRAGAPVLTLASPCERDRVRNPPLPARGRACDALPSAQEWRAGIFSSEIAPCLGLVKDSGQPARFPLMMLLLPWG